MVSLSYNYVVVDALSWAIRRAAPFHRSILMVDEAHNLQNLNVRGDSVTEGTLSRAGAVELGDPGALS